MNHVALISGTALSARNGSSKVESRLARELVPLGFAVTLLTRDTAPSSGEPFRHVTYRRPSSRDWKSWILAGRVADVLAEIDAQAPIDLVHAFQLGPPAYYAARFGRPYLVTHHDMRIDASSWLTRRALASAQHVVALNDAQAALMGPHARGITVIQNGVGGENEAAPSHPLPSPFVLFAGRFEAEKGVFVLLDALAQIPSNIRPKLVLAGEGHERERVIERASGLGATVLPWLSHDVLLGTLSRATALALPSFSEASPLLLLEAYSRGVPVLVHDLPMLGADLRDADGGARATMIPIGDVDRWASALTDVASGRRDEAELSRARAAAHARTWPTVAARYASVYLGCLDAPAIRHSSR